MGLQELRELRQLHDENAKLKRLVADLSLDRHILQEMGRVFLVTPGSAATVISHGIAAAPNPSMSRNGNSCDNAPSETLFASLKLERLHGQRFETIRRANDEILAWLLWYNQTRSQPWVTSVPSSLNSSGIDKHKQIAG